MVVTAAWQTDGRLCGITWMSYGCHHRSSLIEQFDRVFLEPRKLEWSLGQVDVGWLAKTGECTARKSLSPDAALKSNTWSHDILTRPPFTETLFVLNVLADVLW